MMHLSKDVLEKKAQRWESMKTEDTEREFYWSLAGAAFLQIGTWSARYSYTELLWMQRTKQARVQKQEYPAGGLNFLGQIIIVDSVIISCSNITTTVYSEPAG